jgi:hypothetical protein
VTWGALTDWRRVGKLAEACGDHEKETKGMRRGERGRLDQNRGPEPASHLVSLLHTHCGEPWNADLTGDSPASLSRPNG